MRKITRDEKKYIAWLMKPLNTLKDDYSDVLEALYDIEFYSLIDYDDDRGADGLQLREEWAEGVRFKGSLDFGVANMLEVLIGIAKRIEFQLFGTKYYDDWDYVAIFWEMVDNLGLRDTFCDTFEKKRHNVTLFLNREKKRHKNCHIFRFKEDPENLENLNIWDQMGLFIQEKWPI